jgi:hypothetical protein
MRASEVLKMLAQMHRDHRSLEEIHTATMRYCELAEAEEALDAEKPKDAPQIRVTLPPQAPNIM